MQKVIGRRFSANRSGKHHCIWQRCAEVAHGSDAVLQTLALDQQLWGGSAHIGAMERISLIQTIRLHRSSSTCHFLSATARRYQCDLLRPGSVKAAVAVSAEFQCSSNRAPKRGRTPSSATKQVIGKCVTFRSGRQSGFRAQPLSPQRAPALEQCRCRLPARKARAEASSITLRTAARSGRGRARFLDRRPQWSRLLALRLWLLIRELRRVRLRNRNAGRGCASQFGFRVCRGLEAASWA